MVLARLRAEKRRLILRELRSVRLLEVGKGRSSGYDVRRRTRWNNECADESVATRPMEESGR